MGSEMCIRDRFIGVFLHVNPESSDDEDHGFIPQYVCIIAAVNGKLYAPPKGAKRVLEIDPQSGTARTVGEEVCAGGYSCILVGTAAQKKLYCTSTSSRNILKIDISSEVRVEEHERTGEGGYCGLAEAFNGLLYSAPTGRTCHKLSHCLEINPVSELVRELIAVDQNYNSIEVLHSGKILIGMPFGKAFPGQRVGRRVPAPRILIIRPTSDVEIASLQSLLKDNGLTGDFSDICIKVGNAAFPVHRLILSLIHI